MARIILKSPYLKPNAKSHITNFVHYIATREGVENPNDTKSVLPATKFQKTTVEKLLKQYPDTKELYEYEDYLNNPNRENADEYILRVAETHSELLGSREKYIDYIATRPGAVNIAEHGLFNDSGEAIVLSQIAEEIAAHEGNIWTHIISIRREDAQRLGYDNVIAWQDLLRSERNTFAKNMKIQPNNFRWYAAFHNSEHHPHVHMIAYSKDPNEPWLSKKGIESIKKSLASKIFKDDLMQTYIKQTKHRDSLRQDSRIIAAEIVRQINTGRYNNPKLENLLIKLAERLQNLSGKKVYGFLPPDMKATVNLIVDEMAKDERINKLYDLWYEEKFEVIRTYTDTMPEKLPLSQNEDFKPIRNAVIKEALNISLDSLTFEDNFIEKIDFEIKEDIVLEEIDLSTAEHSFKKTKNKYSLYRRAKTLLDVDSPEYNPQKAVSLLIRSAQQGYEFSQYRLGKLFLIGEQVNQDIDYGLKWLWEAEKQNNQYAQILLARTYLKGENIKQDIGLAESLFELAAKQDNAYAQYSLAKMHLNGQAEECSVFRATELLESSAKAGNEYSQYLLGKMLMQGKLIPKDMQRAERLLLSAAASRLSYGGSGNNYAEYLLGKIYLLEDGIPKDVEKAIYYLNNSVVQGNNWAQYQLGKMLLFGKEVEQDAERGLYLLNQSSIQGNIYADLIIENYNKYRNSIRSNMELRVVLSSLRLLYYVSRIIKNCIDEENCWNDNINVIEKKLRQKTAIKKESHGLRL